MLYPNHSTKRGAMAVVGIVWEAIIIGYTASAIFLFKSIITESPTPKTIDIKSPKKVTDIVAGSCTKKRFALSSHILAIICVGEGSI